MTRYVSFNIMTYVNIIYLQLTNFILIQFNISVFAIFQFCIVTYYVNLFHEILYVNMCKFLYRNWKSNWNKYIFYFSNNIELGLHREKYFRNLIKSNINQIVFTHFRLIWKNKQTSVWFQINREMEITIWFWLI